LPREAVDASKSGERAFFAVDVAGKVYEKGSVIGRDRVGDGGREVVVTGCHNVGSGFGGGCRK
jgi:hypothetical protein